MPPRTKPVALIRAEGNTNRRTKAELELREREENRLATGEHFTESEEVAGDTFAHKEFLRLQKMFVAVEKDDALFGDVINRYCKLASECHLFEKKIKKADDETMIKLDKQLMVKRKMMNDIAKENIMTVQAILRAIPKKPEPRKKTPMAEYLERMKREQNAQNG